MGKFNYLTLLCYTYPDPYGRDIRLSFQVNYIRLVLLLTMSYRGREVVF